MSNRKRWLLRQDVFAPETKLQGTRSGNSTYVELLEISDETPVDEQQEAVARVPGCWELSLSLSSLESLARLLVASLWIVFAYS